MLEGYPKTSNPSIRGSIHVIRHPVSWKVFPKSSLQHSLSPAIEVVVDETRPLSAQDSDLHSSLASGRVNRCVDPSLQHSSGNDRVVTILQQHDCMRSRNRFRGPRRLSRPRRRVHGLAACSTFERKACSRLRKHPPPPEILHECRSLQHDLSTRGQDRKLYTYNCSLEISH